MDKLFVNKTYISYNTDDGINRSVEYFNDTGDLCNLIFDFFNHTDYFKIFLNKSVEVNPENPFGTEEVGVFYNVNGSDPLKIVSNAEYLKLIKNFLYQFGYTKKLDEKKLTLK